MEKSERFKTLNIDSTKYKTHYSEKYQQRKKFIPYDDSRITAFIPGTIFRLFVKEGQKVKKGARLVTLEAMKMRNRLICPFNATVKKIHVEQGQNVSKDELLVELERIGSKS